MENQPLLQELLQEIRLVRQALEKIENHLAASPRQSPKKKEQPRLSEDEAKKLYREISAEYKTNRNTQKLDTLLARSKPDLSFFCAVNNLPIDSRKGKGEIRNQIIARIREDEQLSATYSMPSQQSSQKK